MIDSPALKKAQLYVEDFFKNTNPKRMFYHNLEHTQDVVDAVVIVGSESDLDDDQFETALIAAWFHDIGYYKGSDFHEQESARMASEFLNSIQYPADRIQEVIDCIYATRIPQSPKNMVEKVVCDADLAHLASTHYFEKAEKLRYEISISNGIELTEEKWLMKSRGFFEKHRYFTNYGIKVLQPGKLRNYDFIVSILNSITQNPLE